MGGPNFLMQKALDFNDFAISLLAPADGPKNGTVKMLFLAVHAKGPCWEFFCTKVAKAHRFGFNKALWL